MNILFIVPSYKPAYVYGGPIESVAKLCEGLTLRGHNVDVFTTTANGEKELSVLPGKRMNVGGVLVTYFRRVTGDPTHVSPALWKRLYSTVGSYDVVHIQSWWNILVVISALICHVKGAKVIVSPRGMLSRYILNSGSSRAKKIIHNTVGRYALSRSYFHATAASEYEECTGLIKGWKGFVIPNILSLPDIPITKKGNSVFTLIFLSRIHPKKGLEILFEALAKIEANIVLNIAGTGEADYINTLKILAQKLKIEKKIHWLGWLDRTEKFNALMQADLFVLVSRNENFANVVIESLHMGTPVLISEDVALSGFVRENNLGWVSSLDPDDVREKLITAYEDKDKRLRIEAQGRTVTDLNFSEEKLIARYEQEYRKISRLHLSLNN